MLLTSGCLNEGKTVVTARMKIVEEGGTPHITSLEAERHTISFLREYRDTPPHFPGIALTITNNMKKIDYWRSVAYNGEGDYEITTELKTIPNKGDTISVIVKILDEDGKVIDKKRIPLHWQ